MHSSQQMATESNVEKCAVCFYSRFEQVVPVSIEVHDFYDVFSSILGPRFKEGMHFVVDAWDNNGMFNLYTFEYNNLELTKWIQSKVDRSRPINACWCVESGAVYSFGTGAKTIKDKTFVMRALTYQSDKSISTLSSAVYRQMRKRKTGEAEEEREESAPLEASYELFVCKRDRKNDTSVTVVDDNNVEDILDSEVFVNPRQQSYSKLNMLELLKFDFDGVADTNLNPSTFFAEMKKNADEANFRQRIQAAIVVFRVEFVDWEQRIREAVAELVGWAQVIPSQHSFNEKTRRTIAYVPCKFAALLLNRPIFVETPLCVGPSPHVFHGSGPLDIIIGGDDNKSEPPVIIQNVSDRMFIDNEDSDEGEDEEEDYEGAEEDCYVNIPRVVASALPQLSGQCNDIAYVPVKKLHEIAGISSYGGRRGNAADTREGPVSARVFRDISGIITTGNTWDVFHYSTDTLDLHATPRVRYMGSLGMRVLRYKTYTETPAAPAPQMAHPSGAFVAGNVERAEVERVIAMLILSARGQLTLPIQSEAAQVVTS